MFTKSFAVTVPENLIPNGTFDTGVEGWKLWTSTYSKGKLSWDESAKALNFEKTSSSPELYCAAVKVESGTLLDFSYDFKTSVEITDTLKATSVAFFAYTSDYIESVGTTMFAPNSANAQYTVEFVLSGTEWQTKRMTYTVPEGYEYVQIRFAYRGQSPNTILSLDNICLYEIDEDYALFKISNALEIDEDGKYISAGIRFRGQISEQFRSSATEIGFVAVPTENLNGMSIADYVKTEGNIAITAKTNAEGMNENIYAVSTDNEGNKYYDYQLIITGLTRKGVEVNLLDTEITVAMYAVIDGETVYTNTKSASYNYIASLMNR